jgi:redox-sensitive bicupin YhaK (pirin superfamily)
MYITYRLILDAIQMPWFNSQDFYICLRLKHWRPIRYNKLEFIDHISDGASETMIIDGRTHDLGGGMWVMRILPFAGKRQIGPFVFLDHMGPFTAAAGQNTDVRPHPHIGLSTLTYLFEGRIVHRDSIGNVVTIVPGEVNWMTAGRGISHSERTHEDDRGREHRLHGLQFWVALRNQDEDISPSFQHVMATQIPSRSNAGLKTTVVAGEGFGLVSPLKVSSPLIFTEFQAERMAEVTLDFPGFDLGVYVIQGEASIEGEKIATHQMKTLGSATGAVLKFTPGTRCILIGGEPIGEKHIWWNLVSSSKEKIETAKKQWSSGNFPMVPGETDFIPLPEK